MFSVANFLDRAKAGAGIDSDYRLAKLIAITHSAVSRYRHDKSLPDDSTILKLCELSGDDTAVIAAEVQAARSTDDATRKMWLAVAARLQAGVAHVFALVAVAIVSIAAYAPESRAGALPASISAAQSVYYVKSRADKWAGLMAFIRACIQWCSSTLRGHVTHDSFQSA